MFDEYRKSLKHPEAEELFDLWFYRPLGWIFVRLVHRTPITPNQVTMLSLAASLAAAREFGLGALSALPIAAGWYALANVLDCADGQLARVQGSGTPNGRIVDGVADYIGTTAIFLGIGIGFSRLGMNLWPETVLAGLSSALHAAIFDHRQSAFIAARRGDTDFHRREMEKHATGTGAAGSGGTGAGSGHSSEGGEVGGNAGGPGDGGGGPGISRTNNPASGFLSRLYVGYMTIQQRLMHRLLPGPKHTAGAGGRGPEDGALIRLWSFLGPTMNRTALIAFALIGRVDLFLWAVFVPGNIWLVSAWYLQRRIDGRAPSGAEAIREDPR